MRSRIIILAVAAVIAAAAIVAGVVAVAGADSSTPLPTVTAPELLSKVNESHGQTQAVSGEVSWTNGLFGAAAEAANHSFGGMPAQNPLLASGSGRIWMSTDGVRVESQGGGGDQVLVVSEKTHDAWIYDYSADTARHIVVTGGGDETPAPQPSASAMTLTPAAITVMLQRLAPLGSMTVDDQTTIAGRAAYVLAFTPAADDTALGSVRVAVDGEKYVPLRLEVFSKGAAEATLQAGFDSVSFDPIDESRFVFTPPEGAEVTTKTIDAERMHEQGEAKQSELEEQARKALAGGELRRAFLTQDEARDLVPYELATAGANPRPFKWAFVMKQGMPVTALGSPLFDMGAANGGTDPGDGTPSGPAVAQVYGAGLGSIVLMQSPTTPQTRSELDKLPGVFEKLDVNGNQASVVTTPLGGVVVWQQGGTTLIAAGMVPAADLKAFAGSVR